MKKLLLTLISSLSIIILKGQISTNAITASPNPFDKRTLVSYTVQSNDTISLLVMDITGATKITLKSNYVLSAGSYQDSLIMDGFPEGIYYLTLRSKIKGVSIAKIIKWGITNIPAINLNSQIKISPNPVKDQLTIAFETIPEEIAITMFNALGQSIYFNSSAIQKPEINFSSLPSGIYYLKLQNNSGQKTFKIIKE